MQQTAPQSAQNELAQLAKVLTGQIHQLIKTGSCEEAVQLASELTSLLPKAPQSHSVLHQARLAAGDRVGADAAQWRAVEIVAEIIEKSDRTTTLQERMSIFGSFIFIGGPPKDFLKIGQLQIQTLRKNGLEPHHKLLDIGCGCLRAGLHIMPLLEPGNYFGLEPNDVMLQFGKLHVVGPEALEHSKPSFDNNTDFDFTPFGQKFDFYLARSIWTHTSKSQIENMLDSFLETAEPNAVFLTSIYPARTEAEDYKGETWVGRSESSPFGGCIRHSPDWIVHVCQARGLRISRPDLPIENGQVWIRIEAADT